jgi:hypothetical protein
MKKRMKKITPHPALFIISETTVKSPSSSCTSLSLRCDSCGCGMWNKIVPSPSRDGRVAFITQ